MKYRPEIDGLRAIAVLSVVLYHAQLGCPGGYIGVDIFFVISGYLICRTISQEIAEGSFSYRAFWARRIRRLLPALAVMLGGVVLLGWRFLFPQDYRHLGLTIASQPLLGANLVFWCTLKSGYFGDEPGLHPTLHTWSLAVEEQFYLLCPLLLMLLARWRKNIGGSVLAGIALVSWVTSGLFVGGRPGYFLLQTRAFEILIGGLVWYFPPARTQTTRNAWSTFGFACVTYFILYFRDVSAFPGWVAVVPCLGTAIMLNTAQADTILGRLLALPPMVWVGKMSYSIYLWHWPLIAFWRYLFLPWNTSQRWCLVGCSLLAGYLSTQLVENPVRKRRYLADDGSLFRAAVWFSAICLGTGSLLWVARGFPQRYSHIALNYLDEPKARDFFIDLQFVDIENERFIHFGAVAAQLRGLKKAGMFVWGDSHAMSLLSGLDEVCRHRGLKGEAATYFHVDVSEGGLNGWEERRCDLIRSYLKRTRPDCVILVSRWDEYVSGARSTELRKTLRFLESEHLPTWIVLQVPRQDYNMPRRLAQESVLGADLNGCGVSLSRHEAKSREFISWLDAAKFPLSRRLNPTDLLSNSAGICRTNYRGLSLYLDNNHLSNAGSQFLEDMYKPVLTELKGPPEHERQTGTKEQQPR